MESKFVSPDLKDGIRQFIKDIRKIESHYLRGQACRQFVESGKSIADLYKDYEEICKNNHSTHDVPQNLSKNLIFHLLSLKKINVISAHRFPILMKMEKN